MAFSDAQIRAAMANPGASGPGGIYDQIRRYAQSNTGGGGGGGGNAPAAPPPPAAPAPAVNSGGRIPVADVYQTVNGPRTADQMMHELLNVGWDGTGDIREVYARTTGGAVQPAAGSSGVPAALQAPGVPQTMGGGGLSQADIDKLTGAFNLGGAMTQAELDERKRQFDQTLAWTKQMWEQQGLPQLVIQQKAAQLQQDEFEFEKQQALRNQALQEAGVTGTYQGAPTLAARGQAFQEALAAGGLNLQQQQAALDAIKTAAAMGGPENFVQAANYARGVRATDVPVFMQSLLGGVGAPAAMQGVGLSAPQTFAGTAARLGAGGTTTAPTASDLTNTLELGRRIFAQGGAALGPQSLEGLSDTEQKMLSSVGSAVGADMPSFLRQYQASRIGQGAAQAMQHGGIVDRPTVALIGEAGPEAVVPLDPNQWSDLAPPFRSQTTLPTPPLQFPRFMQPQYVNPTIQFESPEDLIATADQLGLKGDDRDAFFMRYLNPAQGQALGRGQPSPSRLQIRSD